MFVKRTIILIDHRCRCVFLSITEEIINLKCNCAERSNKKKRFSYSIVLNIYIYICVSVKNIPNAYVCVIILNICVCIA